MKKAKKRKAKLKAQWRRRRAPSAFELPKNAQLVAMFHISPPNQYQVHLMMQTKNPREWGIVVGLIADAAANQYPDPERAKEYIRDGFEDALCRRANPTQLQ